MSRRRKVWPHPTPGIRPCAAGIRPCAANRYRRDRRATRDATCPWLSTQARRCVRTEQAPVAEALCCRHSARRCADRCTAPCGIRESRLAPHAATHLDCACEDRRRTRDGRHVIRDLLRLGHAPGRIQGEGGIVMLDQVQHADLWQTSLSSREERVFGFSDVEISCGSLPG